MKKFLERNSLKMLSGRIEKDLKGLEVGKRRITNSEEHTLREKWMTGKKNLSFPLLAVTVASSLTLYAYFSLERKKRGEEIAKELNLDQEKIKAPLLKFEQAYLKETGDYPTGNPREWKIKKESLFLLENSFSSQQKQLFPLLFQLIDVNNDGTIDVFEWINAVIRLEDENEEERLNFVFENLDKKRRGYLTKSEISNALFLILHSHNILTNQNLSEFQVLKEAELQAIEYFEKADKNNDQKISKEEFLSFPLPLSFKHSKSNNK